MKITFILTGEKLTREQADILVEVVSDFATNNDLILDETLEEEDKK